MFGKVYILWPEIVVAPYLQHFLFHSRKRRALSGCQMTLGNTRMCLCKYFNVACVCVGFCPNFNRLLFQRMSGSPPSFEFHSCIHTNHYHLNYPIISIIIIVSTFLCAPSRHKEFTLSDIIILHLLVASQRFFLLCISPECSTMFYFLS